MSGTVQILLFFISGHCPLSVSDFQLGAILSSWRVGGHLAKSEAFLVIMMEGGMLLASSGWQPGMLPTSDDTQDSLPAPTRNYSVQNVNSAKVEKPKHE